MNNHGKGAEISEGDLVFCTNLNHPHNGVVFKFADAGRMVDVDFRWGGGGLLRIPRSDLELLVVGWQAKWKEGRKEAEEAAARERQEREEQARRKDLAALEAEAMELRKAYAYAGTSELWITVARKARELHKKDTR